MYFQYHRLLMFAISVEGARIQTSEELLKPVRSPSDLTSAGWTDLYYCNVKQLEL